MKGDSIKYFNFGLKSLLKLDSMDRCTANFGGEYGEWIQFANLRCTQRRPILSV